MRLLWIVLFMILIVGSLVVFQLWHRIRKERREKKELVERLRHVMKTEESLKGNEQN